MPVTPTRGPLDRGVQGAKEDFCSQSVRKQGARPSLSVGLFDISAPILVLVHSPFIRLLPPLSS